MQNRKIGTTDFEQIFEVNKTVKIQTANTKTTCIAYPSITPIDLAVSLINPDS